MSSELTGPGQLQKNRKYRLDLSYLGSPFVGFQTQPTKDSVQDHLEAALKIFFSKETKVTGASRTDSGVHAENQVITFNTDKNFDEHRWIRGINSLTPREIGINQVREVPDDFHPIFSANAKAYRYRIWRGNCWNPFISPYVWEIYKPIDLELFKKSALKLVGTHDFTSFCNTDTDISTKTRNILEIKIDERGPLVDFWIVGEGFLKQMVRIIVGTLIDISDGKLPPDSIMDILNSKSRSAAGKTAPPDGLSLVKVFYGDVPSVSKLIAAAESGFTQDIS